MEVEHVTMRSYLLGFFLSLFLTLTSYFIVVEHLLTGSSLAVTIGGLAALQAFVQLVFFFHLGKEPSPPWKLFVFLFMLLIVAIVVLCTLWIMYNLDYRMMPADMNM